MARKNLYRVYGKEKKEKTGTFYNILSTSKKGAESQVRRKYGAKIISTKRR